jgi:fructose-1,6-bisphosphatase
MIKHIHTLADYLLQEEQTATDASGSFFLLLTRIEVAAKRIADKVRAVGLVDLLGKTGTR